MTEEQRIPLVEERARIRKRKRATARISIKLQTTEETRVLRDVVARDHVQILRVPIDSIVDAAPEIRFEDGVVVVPVVEEELVVRKRLRLKEEVRLTLTSELEPVEIPLVLRRSEATVTRRALSAECDPSSGPGALQMNRTVTAFYSSRQEAEQVREELVGLGVPEPRLDVVSLETHRQHQDDGGGFFSFLGRLFIPKEDHSVYSEGLSRGHAMLTAHLDENEADRAIAVLEQSDAMDLDHHEAEWRTATSQRGIDEGYGYTENLSAGQGGAAAIADSEAGDRSTRLASESDPFDATAQAATGLVGVEETRVTDRDFDPTDAPIASDTEQSIALVRESLVVGKREVGRGGVRVRSYVVETPVEEQIILRTERVAVERRPVDQPVMNAEALLQEGEVTVTETEEVPVVSKEAVVSEEIIVRKDSSERVETVQDKVRRTEVDVEDTRSST